MKKFAVVLSGCGFKDGSEITESVSALIAISEAGADYQIFAPNLKFNVTNHLTGKTEGERSMLDEAARIARGKISDLHDLRAKEFDGIVFPGGYGAAINLCSFAKEGAKAKVQREVERVILDFYAEEKPICAICISPALIALVLGKKKITVTIGDDKDTAKEIEKTGARHENCGPADYVTDRDHRIITTPAYMHESNPAMVFKGIRGAIRELIEMA